MFVCGVNIFLILGSLRGFDNFIRSGNSSSMVRLKRSPARSLYGPTPILRRCKSGVDQNRHFKQHRRFLSGRLPRKSSLDELCGSSGDVQPTAAAAPREETLVYVEEPSLTDNNLDEDLDSLSQLQQQLYPLVDQEKDHVEHLATTASTAVNTTVYPSYLVPLAVQAPATDPRTLLAPLSTKGSGSRAHSPNGHGPLAVAPQRVQLDASPPLGMTLGTKICDAENVGSLQHDNVYVYLAGHRESTI